MIKQGFKSTVCEHFATRLTEVFGCFSLFLRGRTKGKRWTRVLGKSIYVACFPFGCAIEKHSF